MSKQHMLAFVTLLVLQGVALSFAAPKSSGSTAFDEWFKTFDPSTAVASKLVSCAGKVDGFYPEAEPELVCSDTYTACVFGTSYEQKCTTGEVFDSTSSVRKCVNRYVAQSAVCEYTVPPPACTADNVGVYQPTAKCSDLHYICLSAAGQPQFQYCNPGLPSYYFDPDTGRCQVTAGAAACEDEVGPVTPPPTVPVYGCGSDKTTGFAYAITECSTSFYTCDRNTSPSPIPASCNAYGTGLVFDYKATPTKPSSASCIPKSTVPECGELPIVCTNKPDGPYAAEPDTCSTNYYLCYSGIGYLQTCPSDIVFDAAQGRCVSHYAAISDACEANYPAPACNADNVGLYMPTGRCSDVYYICTSAGGSPQFQFCNPGLPDYYFNPTNRYCDTTVGAQACQ